MSKAKSYIDVNGNEVWFNKDGLAPAKIHHLELLSDVEDIDLDDILEENLTQKEVLKRLHVIDGLIPHEVVERRRKRLERSRMEPECRICTAHGWKCEGRITRHHFVPRWLMRELDHYQRYAARSKCTIPICAGRHRDLHIRNEAAKSIVPYLRAEEKELASQMLRELRDERPAIFALISVGNKSSYEYTLVDDFNARRFAHIEENYQVAGLEASL